MDSIRPKRALTDVKLIIDSPNIRSAAKIVRFLLGHGCPSTARVLRLNVDYSAFCAWGGWGCVCVCFVLFCFCFVWLFTVEPATFLMPGWVAFAQSVTTRTKLNDNRTV